MIHIRRCGAALIAVLVLAMTASCERAPVEEPAPEPVAPQWTTYAIPDEAMPSGTRTTVTSSVPGSKDRPVLVVGSSTEPGEAEHATVWLPDAKKSPGKPVVLDVAGESRLDAAGTDGKTTAVAGWVFTDGEERPLVRTSEDHVTWRQLDNPAELAGRSVALHEVNEDKLELRRTGD